MREFLAMGGYAFYVWAAWGVAAIVLTALFVISHARTRALGRRLDAMTGQGRRRPAPSPATAVAASSPADSAEVAS